jgi:peptidoglycan hydrolase-like protein with peptidoglycan-binding domain
MPEARERRQLHGAVSGDQVRLAQRALAAAGYSPGPIDGIYGPLTAKAVRGFQDAEGLTPTGGVNEKTWRALVMSPREGWTASPEEFRRRLYGAVSGPDVEEAQHRLADLGLNPGRIDGVYGPDTERAVLAFQGRVGLRQDGVVGQETWQALLAPDAAETATAGKSDPTSSSHTMPIRNAAPATAQAPTPDAMPAAGRVRPLFAGYTSDRTLADDALGRTEQVTFLCSVLTAKSLETPLAIGLFGGWGSGKSFFMRMLQEQITARSESSAKREKAGGETFYCSHVVQVMFNAWLHADADMWPSLAAKVFRGVAGIDQDVQPGNTQNQDLSDYQREREGEYLTQRASQREDAALRDQIDTVDRQLAQREAELGERFARLGKPAAAALEAVKDADETRGRLRGLRAVWPDLRPWERALLLALPLLAAALVVVAVVRPDLPRAWAPLALAFLSVVTLTRPVLRVTLDAAEVMELRARRRGLEERTRAARLEAQARPGAEAAPLLREYVEEQATRWTARQGGGDLTEIRKAFERLSGLIHERRTASAGAKAASADEKPLAPIDRVVVYIDDLDRCPPGQVVNVLSAINLLLDIPHFVVVVGVDSRWLFRSLEVKFAELLGDAAAGQPADSQLPSASPQEYLEKIFQYSLVLPPVSRDGYERLVDRLLPVRQDAAPSGTSAGIPGHMVRTAAGGPDAAVAEDRTATEPAHDDDLTPRDLAITAAEIQCIRSLAPWFETPRAIKRFTNLYRLIRVSIGEDRVLEGEAFRRILLLLALAISYPAAATEIFRRVRDSRATGPFAEALWNPEMPVVPQLPPEATALTDVGASSTMFADWVSIVAQFSFHPWPRPLGSTPRSSEGATSK